MAGTRNWKLRKSSFEVVFCGRIFVMLGKASNVRKTRATTSRHAQKIHFWRNWEWPCCCKPSGKAHCSSTYKTSHEKTTLLRVKEAGRTCSGLKKSSCMCTVCLCDVSKSALLFPCTLRFLSIIGSTIKVSPQVKPRAGHHRFSHRTNNLAQSMKIRVQYSRKKWHAQICAVREVGGGDNSNHEGDSRFPWARAHAQKQWTQQSLTETLQMVFLLSRNFFITTTIQRHMFSRKPRGKWNLRARSPEATQLVSFSVIHKYFSLTSQKKPVKHDEQIAPGTRKISLTLIFPHWFQDVCVQLRPNLLSTAGLEHGFTTIQKRVIFAFSAQWGENILKAINSNRTNLFFMLLRGCFHFLIPLSLGRCWLFFSCQDSVNARVAKEDLHKWIQTILHNYSSPASLVFPCFLQGSAHFTWQPSRKVLPDVPWISKNLRRGQWGEKQMTRWRIFDRRKVFVN